MEVSDRTIEMLNCIFSTLEKISIIKASANSNEFECFLQEMQESINDCLYDDSMKNYIVEQTVNFAKKNGIKLFDITHVTSTSEFIRIVAKQFMKKD